MNKRPVSLPAPIGARTVSLAAIILAAGLSGCGGEGPFFLDARQELAVSRYYDAKGDRAAAIAAAERAAEVAQSDTLRLRALRRAVTLTSPKTGEAQTAQAVRAMQEAALAGDRSALEKLASLRAGYRPDAAVLKQLVPLLENSARQGSARAPLFLADLAAAGRIAGGKTAATAWREIAAARGSDEARQQLAIQRAIEGDDAAALLHMTLRHTEARQQAALRIANGFLHGEDSYPRDPGVGARFAAIAAEGEDEKTRQAAASMARRLLTGADGAPLDPASAALILSALDKRDPELAAKTRGQAGTTLLSGNGATRDVARAVPLLERAGTSSEGQDLVRGAALRLASGREGAPRDPKMARRLMEKLTSRDDRKLVLAAIAGRGGSTQARVSAPSLTARLNDALSAARKGDTKRASRSYADALRLDAARALPQHKDVMAALSAAGGDGEAVMQPVAERARRGDIDAMLVMADHETAKSMIDSSRAVEAERWLLSAASAGSARAEFDLGVGHAQGRFGTPDKLKAREHLLKAKAGGYAPAQDAVERLGLP